MSDFVSAEICTPADIASIIAGGIRTFILEVDDADRPSPPLSAFQQDVAGLVGFRKWKRSWGDRLTY